MSVCIQRVKWLAAALVLLAAPGAAVTIPVTTARSTGFSSSGSLLTTDAAPDGNWTFYVGDQLSALSTTSPIGAWVVRTTGNQPFNNPGWTGNNASSQWISPIAARRGNNQLGLARSSSYIAVTSFTIPAINPPNWPQWWLVMSGVVWADQGVAGNSFYLLSSNSNTPIYTGTLSGSPSYNTSAAFQMQTWVNPNTTYRLAFILPNTSNTMAGFRLRFTEVYVTPEPAAWLTMASVGAGLLLLSLRRRRRKTHQS